MSTKHTNWVAVTALRVSSFTIVTTELAPIGLLSGSGSDLGMMVIGITLSKFKSYSFDAKFLISALSWKFLAWPIYCFVLLKLLGSSLSTTEQAVIMLMSATPMAGNTVVIANELNVHPEKAATAVMASTLLAVLTAPISLAILQI